MPPPSLTPIGRPTKCTATSTVICSVSEMCWKSRWMIARESGSYCTSRTSAVTPLPPLTARFTIALPPLWLRSAISNSRCSTATGTGVSPCP